MAIRIKAESMTVKLDNRVITTARFGQHARL